MSGDKENSAEAAPAEGGGEPKKKKFAGKTLVLFILLPLLLLGGGGAGAYFFFFAKKPVDEEEHEEVADAKSKDGKQQEKGKDHAKAKAKAKKKNEPPKPVVFYNLPDMLVNLNSQGRRTNFLKISLSLELEDANDIPQIEAVLPRVVDAFQGYLREMRPEDLRGSAGLYRLREELLARVNTSVQPARVNDVLFKEMLIQ
jgi:flagellar FliL protein